MGYNESINKLKITFQNIEELILNKFETDVVRYMRTYSNLYSSMNYTIKLSEIYNFVINYYHTKVKDIEPWLSKEELVAVSGVPIKRHKTKKGKSSYISGDYRIHSTISPYYYYIDENNILQCHYILSHQGDIPQYNFLIKVKIDLNSLMVMTALQENNIIIDTDNYIRRNSCDNQDTKVYIEIN